MTRAFTGFLGDFAAGFLAGLFFGVAFFAAGFRTAGFLAAAFLAAGFLAAGLRLAAAMADVSPVPSEGARALAVDSRVGASERRDGQEHLLAGTPRKQCRAQASRRTGLATGPLVRRLSAAAIGATTRRRVAVDAPRKGNAVRAASRN